MIYDDIWWHAMCFLMWWPDVASKYILAGLPDAPHVPHENMAPAQASPSRPNEWLLSSQHGEFIEIYQTTWIYQCWYMTSNYCNTDHISRSFRSVELLHVVVAPKLLHHMTNRFNSGLHLSASGWLCTGTWHELRKGSHMLITIRSPRSLPPPRINEWTLQLHNKPW